MKVTTWFKENIPKDYIGQVTCNNDVKTFSIKQPLPVLATFKWNGVTECNLDYHNDIAQDSNKGKKEMNELIKNTAVGIKVLITMWSIAGLCVILVIIRYCLCMDITQRVSTIKQNKFYPL